MNDKKKQQQHKFPDEFHIPFYRNTRGGVEAVRILENFVTLRKIMEAA